MGRPIETVFHCEGDLTVRLPARYDVVVLIKEGVEMTIDGKVWNELLDKCFALRAARQLSQVREQMQQSITDQLPYIPGVGIVPPDR